MLIGSPPLMQDEQRREAHEAWRGAQPREDRKEGGGPADGSGADPGSARSSGDTP